MNSRATINTRISKPIWIHLTFVALTTLFQFSGISQNSTVDRLILVSLDGVRTQELFQGLDVELLMKSNKGKKKEDIPLYQRFYGATPEESRAKLMPFFWNEWIANHGVVLGNRHKLSSSTMKLVNRRRFSFPGYSEILTGEAHDKEIKSNDKIQNPFPTILDYLQSEWKLDHKQISCFASWDVFPYIVSSQFNSFYVNAGFQNYPWGNSTVQSLNKAQFEQPTPWDSVRHDFTTFSFAMDYLQRQKPKVFYLALGETDDWAHMDRYDRVLETLYRTDIYLKQLWNYLQTDPFYKDRTGILLCTDHGRGDNIYNWISHNDKLPGAEFVWMAAFSPNISLRGEMQTQNPITQSQIAATLCRMAGLDYSQFNKAAGKPVIELFQSR